MCCTCLCKHMLVRFLNKTSRANCLVVVDFYIYVLARSTIAGSLLFETCVIQRNESDQLNAWVWEIEFLKPKHVCKIFWVQVFVPLAVKLPFTSWQWDLEKKLSVSLPIWKRCPMRKLARCATMNMLPATSQLGTSNP